MRASDSDLLNPILDVLFGNESIQTLDEEMKRSLEVCCSKHTKKKQAFF